VRVMGNEVFEPFVDFTERGRSIEHGVSVTNGRNMGNWIGTERNTRGIKRTRIEAMKDLVIWGRELDIGAVEILVLIQAEIDTAVEILEVFLEVLLSHSVGSIW